MIFYFFFLSSHVALSSFSSVDGAGVLIGIGTVALAGIWALFRFRRRSSDVSLWQRPLDLLVVVGFTQFSVIAILVDAVQAGAGWGPITSSYGPSLLADAFAEWVKSCDPLLGANPLWYWFLAVLSPLLYTPLYVVGILAFLERRMSNAVRNLILMWGALISATTILIILEEFYGSHPSPNRLQMLGGYVPYVIFPLFVVWRVWNPDVFPTIKA